jgi:hypothetical protein
MSLVVYNIKIPKSMKEGGGIPDKQGD